jgi:hypothetical protein
MFDLAQVNPAEVSPGGGGTPVEGCSPSRGIDGLQGGLLENSVAASSEPAVPSRRGEVTHDAEVSHLPLGASAPKGLGRWASRFSGWAPSTPLEIEILGEPMLSCHRHVR